jgi:hypothetical protein
MYPSVFFHNNALTRHYHTVPLRSHKAPPANHHSPKDAHRRKGLHLPDRRPGIPHGRSPRASRQRRQGSQSQTHHASPFAACHPRRRRARHVDPRNDRIRWRPAAHQPRIAAQGRAKEEGRSGCRCRLNAARVKNGGVLGYTRSVLGINGASDPWQGRAAHVPSPARMALQTGFHLFSLLACRWRELSSSNPNQVWQHGAPSLSADCASSPLEGTGRTGRRLLSFSLCYVSGASMVGAD